MLYDMNLNYYERELVCNLLLISNDVGGFFASIIGYAYLMYAMPEALFNPPNWGYDDKLVKAYLYLKYKANHHNINFY